MAMAIDEFAKNKAWKEPFGFLAERLWSSSVSTRPLVRIDPRQPDFYFDVMPNGLEGIPVIYAYDFELAGNRYRRTNYMQSDEDEEYATRSNTT